jgi:hypothetical protein
MGHSHHFLSRLDRVSHDEVELSLGLYNNAPLVKHILARSGLPPRAERVAISLDDRSEGPFLLVTREGRFVTCLGRGMRHEHPVVRRWQLDLLAERHEELKACMRPAERVPEGERAVGRQLDRILQLGDGLSREAFLDLAPLQPLMFPHYVRCLYDVHAWLYLTRHRLRHLERPRPRDHDELEKLWKHLWAVKHLCALIGVGDPVEYYADRPREAVARVTTTVTAVAGEHAAFCLSAVGAWATARFGGAFLPVCGHRFERSAYSVIARQSALELAAVAGAHPRLRGEVLQGMRGLQPRREVAARGRCDDVERERAAARVLGAFARTDDLDVRAALWGAKRLFDTAHAAVARHGWRTVRDVPVEVAMPFAVDVATDWLSCDETVAELYQLTPSIARYRPEDFYVPARWLSEMRDPWSPERSMNYLEALRGYYLKKEPVVAPRTPGRNEPCACGSGVKYKRCCAVAKAPLGAAAEEDAAAAATLADGIWPRAPAAPGEAANDDALGRAEAPANDGAAERAVA